MWLAVFPFLLVLLLGLGALAVELGFRAPRRRERRDPGAFGWRFRKLSIAARRGGDLAGWLVEPPQAPRADGPLIVIVHGWGANMELMLPLARPFLREGFRVLLFDARNHGMSPAQGHSSLPKFAEDALAAMDWARSRGLAGGGLVLVGHSIGAAAALLAASWAEDPPDGVIAISSFAHPARLMARSLRRLRLPGPLVRLVLAYVQWRIGHDYDAIAPQNVIRRLSGLPVLLLHGAEDKVVPPACSRRIAAAAGEGAELHVLPGAGHDSVDAIARHRRLLTGLARAAARPPARPASPAAGGGR